MNDSRVIIERVLFDPKAGASVVLLKEEGKDRILPIWIGQAEALSIAMAMEKVALPRPMTHDLIKSVLENLNVSLVWVRIRSLDEGTFYATIRLNIKDGQIDIDSRPSDAIAIALRMEAPVFVAEQVLSEASQTALGSMSDLTNVSDDFLADLPDEVFGKYKM
jgi:bifunctional DNase/RNase